MILLVALLISILLVVVGRVGTLTPKQFVKPQEWPTLLTFWKEFRRNANHLIQAFRDIVFYTQKYLPYFDLVRADRAAVNIALQSNSDIRVIRNPRKRFFWHASFIGFEPLATTKRSIGVIFYPGAFVAAEVYSPLARSIAENGYYVAILVPSLQLSFTNIDLAEEVMAFWKDQVKHWVIGGHSMGGVVAAAFLKRRFSNTNAININDRIVGLILLASYPSDSGFLQANLSANNMDHIPALATLSIYGSLDGLATPEKVEHYKHLLPVGTTTYCLIEGGNHSQFYYGAKQLHVGDNPATITRERQQEIIRQAILDFLHSVG